MRILFCVVATMVATSANAAPRNVVDAVFFDKCMHHGGGARDEWLISKADKRNYDRLFPRYMCR